MGFKEAFKGEYYRILSIGTSSVPLTIEQAETKTPLENQTYPIFFTKDIQQTHKTLREKGLHVSEIKMDGVNHFFDFYDLDHNKLKIWK